MRTFRKFGVAFLFLTSVFLCGCQKDDTGKYSWQTGEEYKTLKKLGVDMSDLKISTVGGFVNVGDRLNAMGDIYCGVQDGKIVLYLVSIDINSRDATLVDKIVLGDSVDYPDITVDVGYGQTKTISFQGENLGPCIRCSGTTYFTISDYFSEPTKEGQLHDISSIASLNQNYRMVIYRNGSSSIFSIDGDKSNCLFAPAYGGGVIYNGNVYSTEGKVTGVIPKDVDNYFFDYGILYVLTVEDWYPIDGDKYLGITFSQLTDSGYGILGNVTYFSLSDGELTWDDRSGYTAMKYAFSEAGITDINSDRLDNIENLGHSDGVYRYSLSGVTAVRRNFTIK